MTKARGVELLNDVRSRMGELRPIMSVDIGFMITFANLLIQIQWTEDLLKQHNADDEVPEEGLLSIGYIRGVLQQFKPQQPSVKTINWEGRVI